MANDVQISIKLDRELFDAFSVRAESLHRPKLQIIRELIHNFVTNNTKEPSETTLAAMQQVETGEVFSVRNFDDMLEKCGVNAKDKAHIRVQARH